MHSEKLFDDLKHVTGPFDVIGASACPGSAIRMVMAFEAARPSSRVCRSASTMIMSRCSSRTKPASTAPSSIARNGAKKPLNVQNAAWSWRGCPAGCR